MNMVLYFEGQDIETMSREQLINALKFAFAENEKLRREVERLHRDQVDGFHKLAQMAQAQLRSPI